MFKFIKNGVQTNLEDLYSLYAGAWVERWAVSDKENGVTGYVWIRPMRFYASESGYAVINPPTTTKIEVPSNRYRDFYQRFTDEMYADFYASAGDQISIQYSHWTTRPNIYYQSTHTGIYFISPSFAQNYSYELPAPTSGGGTGGTFQTTITTTGLSTLTIRYENDNPSSGGSANYGDVKIGNIFINNYQVYVCSIN